MVTSGVTIENYGQGHDSAAVALFNFWFSDTFQTPIRHPVQPSATEERLGDTVSKIHLAPAHDRPENHFRTAASPANRSHPNARQVPRACTSNP